MSNRVAAQVRRADGSVEPLTCVLDGNSLTDFRTLDGAPLVLEPQAQIEIPIEERGPDA